MGNFNETFGGGMLQAAGNSVLGSLIGIATAGWQDRRQLEQQRKLQELQEAGNKRMADYQQKLAMQMWEQTNYPAQIEQLKLAGLNPGLLYGKGGGGGTTANANVGSVSGASASSGQNEIFQGIGLMQQQQQMRLQDAQIKVLESQANKNNVDAEIAGGVGKDKILAETNNLVKNANKIDEEIKNIIQSTNNERLKGVLIEAQTAGQELANCLSESTMYMNIDSIYYESKQAMYNYKMAKIEYGLKEDTYQDNVKLVRANAIGAILINSLTDANIKKSIAETLKTDQDVQNSIEIVAQNWEKLNQSEKQLKIDGLVKSIEAYYKGENFFGTTIQYGDAKEGREKLKQDIIDILDGKKPKQEYNPSKMNWRQK